MAPRRPTAALRIDAYASQPHYADHIRPIWNALPLELRGSFSIVGRLPRGAGPIIVAGVRDLIRFPERAAVLVEHGAGQTYGKGIAAYPGGTHREGVALFVCPSERVARLNQEAYPGSEVAVVGAPTLDPWHRLKDRHAGGRVGVAFHWDAHICPEARWAFPHYVDAVRKLAAEHELIGHAHPRAWKYLKPYYRRAGIRWGELRDVYDLADVLVVDNSSVGWEFCSLDRPVVWLNAPWYRRDVEHGLRFWEYADAGIQVDEPDQLLEAVAAAFEDPTRDRRREVVPHVYAHTDGRAAERAAAAIVALVGGRR